MVHGSPVLVLRLMILCLVFGGLVLILRVMIWCLVALCSC